jgi:hypothetical protein
MHPSNIDTNAPKPNSGYIMLGVLRRAAIVVLAGVAASALGVRAAQAQEPPAHFVAVSPAQVTLTVGESRSFRLVDQDGHMQHDVEWSISIPEDFTMQPGDEVSIVAKDHGHYTLRGRSSAGSAEAQVTVSDGPLKNGTIIWGDGKVPGCEPKQIVQAIPTANGPSVYEITHCPDGDYAAAYTSDGMQMWRRRVGANVLSAVPVGPSMRTSAPLFGAGTPTASSAPAARMDAHSGAVCDSVVVGMEQQKVRDLLDDAHLSFSEGTNSLHEWIIDERGAQCTIWFDESLHVSKKRKTLTDQ